jgi:hypothetical protein
MTNRALDEVPDSPGELVKLARRLGFETANGLQDEIDRVTNDTRERFQRLMERERLAPR